MMLIDNITLADIYDFMETGNPDNAPQKIVDYIELLTRIHGMMQRIDKWGSREMVIKHVVMFDTLSGEKISRYKAAQMYNEALEYFYNDKEVSKQAWNNFYATIMEQAINFARRTMMDPSDAKKVVDMAETARKARGGDKPDIEEIPEELFRTPFIIYSCDAEMLGLPKVDRNRLAAQIDAYPDLTEKERIQIKREAQILPIKIFPHESEDPRKS